MKMKGIPSPQEIRDRLARVETVLKDAHTELAMKDGVSPDTVAAFLDAKTNILHAAATTLLVEAQDLSNMIATAQVWATMGENRNAREILSNPRLRASDG